MILLVYYFFVFLYLSIGYFILFLNRCFRYRYLHVMGYACRRIVL